MLPFQILYDQGVITGFVWQVILKEQFYLALFVLNNQLTPAQKYDMKKYEQKLKFLCNTL